MRNVTLNKEREEGRVSEEAPFELLRYYIIPFLIFFALIMAFLYVGYGHKRKTK